MHHTAPSSGRSALVRGNNAVFGLTIPVPAPTRQRAVSSNNVFPRASAFHFMNGVSGYSVLSRYLS